MIGPIVLPFLGMVFNTIESIPISRDKQNVTLEDQHGLTMLVIYSELAGNSQPFKIKLHSKGVGDIQTHVC